MEKNKKEQIKESSKKTELLNEAKALAELNAKLRTPKRRLAVRLA